MRRPESPPNARAFLGRPAPESASHFLGTPKTSRCRSGGHSMGDTGPESTVPRAASGGGGAGLLPQEVLRTSWGPQKQSPAVADAGEGRA